MSVKKRHWCMQRRNQCQCQMCHTSGIHQCQMFHASGIHVSNVPDFWNTLVSNVPHFWNTSVSNVPHFWNTSVSNVPDFWNTSVSNVPHFWNTSSQNCPSIIGTGWSRTSLSERSQNYIREASMFARQEVGTYKLDVKGTQTIKSLLNVKGIS
jgi:nicotinamide mononucleotide adenylyltransferase